MTDVRASQGEMEGFSLGEPVVVCRWRLAGGALPLENRHLRALAAREVDGRRLPTTLVNWAKQHIEWTLRTGSSAMPDGVLMIIVDDEMHAAMTVGPFEPLPLVTADALVARALASAKEACESGVAPETVWAVRDGSLVAGMAPGRRVSGAASLVVDLAETLGIPQSCDPTLAASLSRDGQDEPAGADEVLLVSDEYGVIPASDASGPLSGRLADGYARLLEETSRRAARRR